MRWTVMFDVEDERDIDVINDIGALGWKLLAWKGEAALPVVSGE